MFERLPDARGEAVAITSDGRPNQQGCLVPVEPGMRVETQGKSGQVATSA
jgi:2Fe-2S iron-sulfur cluster binding domain